MKKSLIVISAGAFGREVRYIALGIQKAAGAQAPWEFAGFLDDREGILDGKHASTAPVLGSPASYVPKASDVFICAIGNPSMRRTYAKKVREKGGQFTTLIDPWSRVGRETTVGDGSLVGPFCAVSCDVRTGRDTVILPHATIGHDVKIGEACHIGACAFLGGEVTLGDEVTVHPHATILPGVTLHDRCVVGAGAVVASDVAAGTSVFGAPARRVAT